MWDVLLLCDTSLITSCTTIYQPTTFYCLALRTHAHITLPISSSGVLPEVLGVIKQQHIPGALHLLQLLAAAAKEPECVQDLLKSGLVPLLMGLFKSDDHELAEQASEVSRWCAPGVYLVCPWCVPGVSWVCTWCVHGVT